MPCCVGLCLRRVCFVSLLADAIIVLTRLFPPKRTDANLAQGPHPFRSLDGPYLCFGSACLRMNEHGRLTSAVWCLATDTVRPRFHARPLRVSCRGLAHIQLGRICKPTMPSNARRPNHPHFMQASGDPSPARLVESKYKRICYTVASRKGATTLLTGMKEYRYQPPDRYIPAASQC